MLDTFLRHIFIPHVGISEKTTPICNSDPPPTSTTVKEVDRDYFSTQKDNHKKKWFEENKLEEREGEI